MDKFLFKLFGYALLGLVVFMIMWKFTFYACIGLIIIGFFYFGLRRIQNKKKNKKKYD